MRCFTVSRPSVFPWMILLASMIGLACLPLRLMAGPFDEVITFTQPGGQAIQLRGHGDEFYAVFETVDGYTVAFDHQRGAYCFAELAADGSLVPGPFVVGQRPPELLGLTKGLRMSPEARKRQVAERWKRWDAGMHVAEDWAARKEALRQWDERTANDGPVQLAPPSSTTTGAKLGLTLLVDFSDDVATVPQAEIVNFCNGDAYTGYGNNGSVKQYYLDNSNGLLMYSNVVTIYIRAPKPKSFYNITTNDAGAQANILIKDVLDTMKALPNYASQILPTFANLTVDASSRVVACNVFYAGGNGGVWSFGLWPHSWSLYNVGAQALGNGKSVYKYQITNIGTSLATGTFCHENGHMLCGFPDIYDYDYDSTGGAGGFCLMNSGGSGGNPAQICAYLKRAAGWATTINVTSNSNLRATVGTAGTNFNVFYRYQKPNVTTEYYLLENRQRAGRDAGIPGAGVLIWHVDELGDHDNQGTNYNTTHANYEVALIQADNQYHFERDVNSGDTRDPYYQGNSSSGYSNEFSLTTSPSARWRDGTPSGAIFAEFSTSGTTMTFRVGPREPPVSVVSSYFVDANGNGAVDYNETNQYWVVLRNEGVTTASNVTATLASTTAQVSVLSNSAAYPNIGPGAQATNLIPFVFATAPGFTCGTPIQFTAVAVASGRTTTNAYSLPTGSVGPVSHLDNDVAQFIPDLGTIYSTNVVSGFTGTLGKVTVSLCLSHAYDGNLVIDLLGPDGTTNNLVRQRGGSGDHFGTNCTPDAARTTFDDSAANAITAGSAPFVGAYRPEVPFSVYAGKSGAAVNGPWRLRIRDATASNTGTLQCWSLTLTPPATCIDGALQPPSVGLLTPTNRQLVEAGVPLVITASATDADSPLTSVTLSADGVPLASFVAPPFEYTWTNPPAGAHWIAVRATDTTGLFASSGVWVGMTDGAPMEWSGSVNSLWGEPFNWTHFRTPTNGEALLFETGARLAVTNNFLSSAGPITLAGGFTVGGNWLTLLGGLSSSGTNEFACGSRLGAPQTFISSNGLLTVSGNVTNNGQALTFDGDGNSLVKGWLSGAGSLQKRGTGKVTLTHTNGYTGGTVVHQGTLALGKGGLAGIVRGSLTVSNGAVISAEGQDALGLGASRATPILVMGGTLRNNADTNLCVWGTTLSMLGGTLLASGPNATWDFGTDANANNTSTIIGSSASDQGSLIAGTAIRLRQTTTVFSVQDGPAHPDLRVLGPIVSYTSPSGISKVGPGALALTGVNTFNGPTSVSAGLLLVDGELGTNVVSVASGATLGGDGLVGGRVVIYSGGTLAPGDGIGRLTISNTLTLAGFARFEIGRLGSKLTNDLVRGISSLTLGGALLVTNVADALQAGDQFRLFSANTYMGSFSAVSLPPLEDGLGWDLSALATSGTIAVATLPVITQPPQSQSVAEGAPAIFTVTAVGAAPLSYQWRKDGAPLAGATDTGLAFPTAALGDAGSYDVVVTNAAGSVVSSPATLTVTPPPPTLAWQVEGGSLRLSWPSMPLGFRLQSQTNTAGEGIGPLWFDVPDVATNAFVVPLDPTAGAVFYRLLKP